MTVYGLYMFNKTGQCIFSRLYHGADKRLSDHEKQLIFGFVFQVRKMANSLSPRRLDTFESQVVLGFTTDQYRMHIFETMTGVRIAMLTDPDVPEQVQFLREVYALFVDCAVKNPLYKVYEHIKVDSFRTKFDELLISQPFFK
eukprot:TRINITY_DN20251_c0_g2_i1.p1 TRINITY_DN20251_c0_g2~~TRINITY_DN20251_c0_g2_i1.p1  ORF type:complete len:143 (-),score=39.20 TRINITY_DN20251_c0_g2_i1:24-452(-)